MSAQVRGMSVAVRNANDGISLAQTAEGSLGKIGDNLQRMRELAVQSRNATNSDGDRANMNKEFKELQAEIKRTVNNTAFNGKKLLDGTSGDLDMQVGAKTTAEDRITMKEVDLNGTASLTEAVDTDETVSTAAVAVATAFTSFEDDTNGISIGGKDSADADVTVDDIDTAIQVIDVALDRVNEQRATFGAAQNRFEAVISNLQVGIENQTASRGRIVDADFATETSNLSRAQILQQAGTAMVAQANQLPQQVLTLLR